ncbi:MAG: hypothetical protein S4CHLAM6_12280 [Chlamydiae bacterium]|nr:hypothetical protein [Chlamydiota bacterium]
MLGFLKKYQKIFFVFVALLVGTSVMFVGLLPKNLSGSNDRTLFRTVTGKKIKQSHYDGLKALLTTNNGELLIYGQNLGMNFFPEDVFTQNLVESKLIRLIAEKKKDELKEFWVEQQAREKHYKPYSHPQMSNVSAENVWFKHAPRIPELLKQIQAEENPSKLFDLRADLFLEENNFSPFALWQFLSEKQSQYQWIQKDEAMAPFAISLFGYRSLQDWFGEKMMDYVCQFVLQVSSIAKQKGYQASYKEAENSLLKLNDLCFKQLQFLGLKEFSDSTSYFHAKLNRLGMNKMQMISLWREVLTFQNFLNEAAHSALLDDLTLNDFEQYATEQVEICRYQPPEYLKFNSLNDLGKFEVYLTALGKPKGEIGLDFALKPTQELEKKFPQLVEHSIELEYKEIDVNQAAISVSVQDIWKWRADHKNCQKLVSRFPKLNIDEKMSPKEYQAAFENVDYFTQMQVDQYIRQQLLKQDENWLTLAFEKTQSQKDSFKARRSGYKLPFKGLELFSKKQSFLKQFFSDDESNKFLEPVTFDDVHFYQILSVKPLEKPKVVSYQDLLLDKTAEKMLHQTLTKLHKKGALNEQDFPKVKEKVLDEYLAPIKEAIIEDYTAFSGSAPQHLNDLFYCKYRLYSPMRNALAYYTNQQDENCEPYAFNSFLKIDSSNDVLVRHQNNSREMEKLMEASEGEWSCVGFKSRVPVFTQVLFKKSKQEGHPMQKQLHARLSQEAISALATELLDQVELENYSNH